MKAFQFQIELTFSNENPRIWLGNFAQWGILFNLFIPRDSNVTKHPGWSMTSGLNITSWDPYLSLAYFSPATNPGVAIEARPTLPISGLSIYLEINSVFNLEKKIVFSLKCKNIKNMLSNVYQYFFNELFTVFFLRMRNITKTFPAVGSKKTGK